MPDSRLPAGPPPGSAGAGRHPAGEAGGAALVLLSAAGFGAMAIFGKLAYDAGVSTLTLLFVRFVLAATIFGAIVAARPALGPSGSGRRAIGIGLALGAVGYAAQSGLFFGALQRMDASLLALLLYTYPAWVTLGAVALGRERLSGRRLAALGLASGGLAIVLAGAASGSFDAAGAAMGLGASLAYTVYILVADRTGLVMPALGLSGLVCAGAAATFGVVGLAAGQLDFGFQAEGWIWLALMAVVSTTVAIVAFFAGLARVGPSAAAILSTFEPVVTVALAFAVFGEQLSPLQLCGAALVLAAAVLLSAPRRVAEPVPPA